MTISDIRPLPAMRGEALWERWRLRWWSGSWFRMAAPWTNHPHRHHGYHELCLTTHGRGRFDHGAERAELTPGTVFISDLEVVHEISCREHRDLALAFFSMRLERIDRGRPRTYPDRVCARFAAGHRPATERPELLAYLPLLCAAGHGDAVDHRRHSLVAAFVIEALAGLVTGAPEPVERGVSEHEDDAVAAALRYVDRHLERPLEVAEIAASVGLGERQLRRRFERHLGTTVVGAVRDRRLDAACKLLAMRMPVAAVAAQVGIGSAAGFARQFRRRYGLSPSDYRQRHAPRAAVDRTTFGPD